MFIGFIPVIAIALATGLSLNPATLCSARVMWLISIGLIVAWQTFHTLHHLPVLKTYGCW